MSRKREKGFTLVELLATIAIISILLGIAGYFIFGTINKSKEKSKNLAINNVKETASVYAKEYPDEVIWTKEATGYYACIPTEMLINRGYLKEKELEDKEEILSYIILKKDKDGTIISEEFDKNNKCAPIIDSQKLDIPTSKSVCANPYYNGNPQNLVIENYLTDKVNITNNQQTYAGEYNVIIKLTSGYLWKDNTKTSKTIKCSIRKVKPDFHFDPNGTSVEELKGLGLGTITAKLKITENVAGKITYKTSNNNYAVVSDEAPKRIDTESIDVPIKLLSTRASTTYITATFKPDNNNYAEVSTTYTIGSAKRKQVPKPTNKYCKTPKYKNPYPDGIYFNATEQELTKKPCEEDIGGNCTVYKNDKDAAKRPYNFLNNKGTAIGTYTITARLNYGYVWTDEKSNDVTITCEIKRPHPTITYDSNQGSSCSKIDVTYGRPYGKLCSPSRTGYIFKGWYKDGKEITSTSEVTDFNDHKLTAKWEPITYYIKFNSNGGSGSMSNLTCKYDQDCYLTSNRFSKTGYTFTGWATSSSGNVVYSNNTSVLNLTTKNNDTINLYAKWKANTYYISFDRNGGSGSMSNITCTYDQYCSLPSNKFSRTGYNFNGWRYNGRTYSNRASVRNLTATNNGTVTLNAVWAPITYYIDFDGNGNSRGSTSYVTCKYGEYCRLRWNGFSKYGYRFTGWRYNSRTYSEGATVYNLTTTDDATLTFYAQWSPKTYTIKLNGNDSDQEPGKSQGRPYPSTTCTMDTWCEPPRPSFKYTRGTQRIASWTVIIMPPIGGSSSDCWVSDVGGRPDSFYLGASIARMLNEETDDIALWACWK